MPSLGTWNSQRHWEAWCLLCHQKCVRNPGTDFALAHMFTNSWKSAGQNVNSGVRPLRQASLLPVAHVLIHYDSQSLFVKPGFQSEKPVLRCCSCVHGLTLEEAEACVQEEQRPGSTDQRAVLEETWNAYIKKSKVLEEEEDYFDFCQRNLEMTE